MTAPILSILTPWTDRPWLRPVVEMHAHRLALLCQTYALPYEWLWAGQAPWVRRCTVVDGAEGTVPEMRRQLLYAAGGEWVMWLDSDDWLSPSWVCALLERLTAEERGEAMLWWPSCVASMGDGHPPQCRAQLGRGHMAGGVLTAALARAVPYPDGPPGGNGDGHDSTWWREVEATARRWAGMRGDTPGRPHGGPLRGGGPIDAVWARHSANAGPMERWGAAFDPRRAPADARAHVAAIAAADPSPGPHL